jgi:hypothetical protein
MCQILFLASVPGKETIAVLPLTTNRPIELLVFQHKMDDILTGCNIVLRNFILQSPIRWQIDQWEFSISDYVCEKSRR